MEEAPGNRRVPFSLRRFSLWQLFLLVAIASVIIAAWVYSQRTGLDDYKLIKIEAGDHVWLINMGAKDGRLVYAFLRRTPVADTYENPVEIIHSGKFVSAELTKSDGTKVALDGSTQLFENIDGQFRESDERVTLEQFESFLDGNRRGYTIKDLLEYAKAGK